LKTKTQIDDIDNTDEEDESKKRGRALTTEQTGESRRVTKV
jgi:hypothetical protein